MALPQEFIDTLLARNDIESVVSSYVKFRRTGRNLVGLCPFHGEKTPSFVLYPENNSFYCFGCGVGGDTITFVRKIENLDYMEAVRFLAQRAGMELPEQDRREEGMAKMKLRLYEANREAARFYHACLYSEKGKAALEYLHGRNLSDATIRHFGLGYSPDGWQELCRYLQSKGFTENEMVLANLASRSQSRGNVYDRFRNRVMFPIIDLRGNVLGFGGRVMDGGEPKYLNTSDTPVFNKGDGMFAMNFAKNVAKEYLILSEGYMDVIAMHQAGFQMAVATLGTALTSNQALLISRYVKEVVLCYDADNAGQKATARAIPILKKAGLQVRVLTIPDAKDPDEFIRTKGAERFKMLVENSGDDVDYRLSKLRSAHDTNRPEGKVNFLNAAVELLASLDNPIERDVYVGRLSGEMGVEKATLLHQIEVQQKKKRRSDQREETRRIQRDLYMPRDSVVPDRGKNLRSSLAEESLLAYLIRNPDRISAVAQKLAPDQFSNALYGGMYQRIQDWHKEGVNISLSSFSPHYSVEEMGKITQIIVKADLVKNSLEAENDFVRVIQEEAEKLSVEEMAQKSPEEIQKLLQDMKKRKS